MLQVTCFHYHNGGKAILTGVKEGERAGIKSTRCVGCDVVGEASPRECSIRSKARLRRH